MFASNSNFALVAAFGPTHVIHSNVFHKKMSRTHSAGVLQRWGISMPLHLREGLSNDTGVALESFCNVSFGKLTETIGRKVTSFFCQAPHGPL